MIILFYYLDPLQKYPIVMSWCMHYVFCQGREVKHWDESVTKRGEGKDKISLSTQLRLFVWAQNKHRFACPFFILGMMLHFPFPISSFLSQGKHSHNSAKPLSLEKHSACIMTSQLPDFEGDQSNKKAWSYYCPSLVKSYFSGLNIFFRHKPQKRRKMRKNDKMVYQHIGRDSVIFLKCIIMD